MPKGRLRSEFLAAAAAVAGALVSGSSQTALTARFEVAH